MHSISAQRIPTNQEAEIMTMATRHKMSVRFYRRLAWFGLTLLAIAAAGYLWLLAALILSL